MARLDCKWYRCRKRWIDYAVRGIEIKICSKDEEHPEIGARAFVSSENFGNIVYQTHVQNIGWQKQVADGETAGTVGQNLGIEGFKIYYLGYGEEPKTEGSVIYQAHVSDVGWQPEVTEGATGWYSWKKPES